MTTSTPDNQDAERTPSTGDLRVNVDTDRSEIYDGGKWVPIIEHNKPLTDSEIRTIQDMCHLKNVGYNNFIMRFARAIERAHGIGE